MALPTKIFKTDAAALLSITRVTLDRRADSGVYTWPPSSWAALVQEHVDYELRGRVDTDEGERLIAARRRKLELEIALMEGGLLDATEVKDMVGMMITNTRSRLLAIPHAIAQQVRPDAPSVAYALIEGAIHSALHELADNALRKLGGNGHA
jgi:hypothetical protein